MRKKFFIQSFDGVDINGLHADLHLSDYNFEEVEKIEPLSQLRWVTLVDGNLWPGGGTGTLEMWKYTFRVTYAWGGRGKPHAKDWNDRSSYTTRISLVEDDAQHLKEIREQIIIDESGALTKDIAFRKYHNDLKGPASYRKRLKEHNAETSRLKRERGSVGGWRTIKCLSKKQIEEAVARFAKKWKDPMAVVTIHNFMRNIETDMLSQV